MNRDERLIAAWLRTQGHDVCHMSKGEDPPDLVVNGNIAVEVITIVSYAYRSLRDLMDSVCRSLGSAEVGRGYWIDISSNDEVLALLQGEDKQKVAAIKRELKHCAKAMLRKHYDNPDMRRGFKLPHGVRIIIKRINNNRDDVKYKVGVSGPGMEDVVLYLIEAIQAAIDKKTNKRLIKERADSYAEWWLAMTDPYYVRSLASQRVTIVANKIRYGEPWRRILLADTGGGRVNAVHCLAGNGR